MGTYLLTFKSENKDQIIKHIKSFKNWAKIKEDVWCIYTSLNSKSIRDNFTSLLKEGQDLFFVINVDESLNKYSSLYEPQISDKNFELQPNDNGLKR